MMMFQTSKENTTLFLKFKNDDDLEFNITGKLDDPIDGRVSVDGFGKWSRGQ